MRVMEIIKKIDKQLDKIKIKDSDIDVLMKFCEIISGFLSVVCFLFLGDRSLGTLLFITSVVLVAFKYLLIKCNEKNATINVTAHFSITKLLIAVPYIASIFLSKYAYLHADGILSTLVITPLILVMPSLMIRSLRSILNRTRPVFFTSFICVILQHIIHVMQIFKIEFSQMDIWALIIAPFVLFSVTVYVIISIILSLSIIFPMYSENGS